GRRGGDGARRAGARARHGRRRAPPRALRPAPARAVRPAGGTMSRRPRAGFTLLEMALVLVLIGLLATLVVPRVLGRTAEARRVRAAADLQILAQALERYGGDAGVSARTARGRERRGGAPTLPPVPTRWRPDGYLPSVPRDPWNHAYQYACVDGRHFTLRSLGADGEPGGDGEAADVDVDAP